MASEKAAELAECADSLSEPANSLRDVAKRIAGTASTPAVRLPLLSSLPGFGFCFGLAGLTATLSGCASGLAYTRRLARWPAYTRAPLGSGKFLRRNPLRSGHLCG
jgi:hypothetical protein